MEYKANKLKLFKKKINAPKAILDNIDNCELSIHDYINYNLKDKVDIEVIDEKYRNIIKLIGIDEAINLNWNFVDPNIDWVTSILHKYDSEYSDYMDYIYAMAYNDIVIDRTRKVLYSKNMDLEFKKRFPQIFLNNKVNKDVADKYYNYNLTINDYVNNFSIFDNKYVAHTLYAGDFFKNILKNINDECLNEFVKDNYELTLILLDDETALLNIIALYQVGMSNLDKKEIFRNFINTSNLKITINSIKVLKKYFSLDEIISGSNNYVKKLINKYGLEKLENYNINIHEIDENIYNAIELFGLNNIVSFDKDNNNFLTENSYKNLSDIYIKVKHNLSYLSENIEETLYNLFQCEYYDYRKIGDSFKKKYNVLFLEDNAPSELKDLYYSNKLNAEILQNNRNFIKYLIDKNYNTGFKKLYIVVNNEESNIYDLLISILGTQETYNLIADYGYTFDQVFSKKIDIGTVKGKKDIYDVIENVIYTQILSDCPFNEMLPAKFKIKHKDLFLDIMVNQELKDLFYNKQLTFKLLFEKNNYLKYLENINLHVCFKNKYDIFDNFQENRTILTLISKYGDILENVKNTNFYDILYKIISKKDTEINEIIFNDRMILKKLISYRNKNCLYKNYLRDIINLLPKENQNMPLSLETSLDILNVFKEENKNISLFNKLTLDAFNSFLEQNDNRFTPQFITLYNNQNDSNYKIIEDFVSFYLTYKFNSLNIVFKNEFHLLLSKPNKNIDDYIYICHYLRAIKNSKYNDDELRERYEYGITIIKDYLLSSKIEKDLLDSFINNILNNKSSILNIKYIKDNKKLKYVLSGLDIYNNIVDEYITNQSEELLASIDSKGMKYIYDQLAKLDFDNKQLIELSFNIYFSIGYENAKILFSKNKKTNFKNRILYMFKFIDINSIFDYKDVINKLIFSNDEYGTPLNNYFDDFDELNNYLEIEINNIHQSTSNDYEKSNKINLLDSKVSIYKESLLDLFDKFHRMYNESDLIKEYLDDTIDIVDVNKLLNDLTNRRVSTILDDRDTQLVKINHLNHVGYNNSIVNEYLKELVNISRTFKKDLISIPTINFSDYNLTLNTLNIFDKIQFNFGYSTKSELSIDGKDKELLNKITSDSNYSSIYITKDEKIICVIPIIRSGNILILDGLIYDSINSQIFNDIIKLLKIYASKLIEVSRSNNSNSIKCVLLNNKNLLHIKEDLPILSNLECKSFDDICDSKYIIQYILYNEDCYLNSASNNSNYLEKLTVNNYESLYFEEKDIDNIYDLNSIKNRIIILANKRRKELLDNNPANAYELLKEIKELQTTYKLKYNLLLESTNKDIISIYNKALFYIKKINTVLGKITTDNKYKLLKYSNNWYIGITVDDEVCCAHLSSGKKQYTVVLKETMEEIKNSLTDEEKKIKARLDRVKGDKNVK